MAVVTKTYDELPPPPQVTIINNMSDNIKVWNNSVWSLNSSIIINKNSTKVIELKNFKAITEVLINDSNYDIIAIQLPLSNPELYKKNPRFKTGDIVNISANKEVTINNIQGVLTSLDQGKTQPYYLFNESLPVGAPKTSPMVSPSFAPMGTPRTSPINVPVSGPIYGPSVYTTPSSGPQPPSTPSLSPAYMP